MNYSVVQLAPTNADLKEGLNFVMKQLPKKDKATVAFQMKQLEDALLEEDVEEDVVEMEQEIELERAHVEQEEEQSAGDSVKPRAELERSLKSEPAQEMVAVTTKGEAVAEKKTGQENDEDEEKDDEDEGEDEEGDDEFDGSTLPAPGLPDKLPSETLFEDEWDLPLGLHFSKLQPPVPGCHR